MPSNAFLQFEVSFRKNDAEAPSSALSHLLHRRWLATSAFRTKADLANADQQGVEPAPPSPTGQTDRAADFNLNESFVRRREEKCGGRRHVHSATCQPADAVATSTLNTDAGRGVWNLQPAV